MEGPSQQEVINWPIPPLHAGADDLIAHVGSKCSLCSELALGRRRNVPGDVVCRGVAVETDTFSQSAEELAASAEHGLSFCSSEILAVLSVAFVDEGLVDVGPPENTTARSISCSL